MPESLSEGTVTTATTDRRSRPVSDAASAPRERIRSRRVIGERFWRDARRRRMLAAADVAAAVVATVALVPRPELAIWGLLYLPVWLLLAKLMGLYDRDHRAVRHMTVDEMPTIGAWAGIGAAGAALFFTLTPIGSTMIEQLAVAALAAAGSAVALRAVARSLFRRLTPPERTAVVGDGELAWAARRKIELFRDMHLELLPDEGPLGNGDAARELDGIGDLAARADRIIVASEHIDPDWIGAVAGICRDENVKLSVVSPLRGRASAVPRLSEVADLPVLEYDTWDVSRSTMLIKRAFDAVVASAALLVLAPAFPLVALAIKLDSRGPVIFRQRRAGMGGRPFVVYKLRTMQRDAEERLPELVAIDELEEPMFKLRRDPRVTRVGRLLRRFSIDELPQLVNVLKGDMSLVGPRPEMTTLVDRYAPEHRIRLSVRPGMTGPMQIFGRGALTFQERLAVELDYIDNLSLSRDFRIIGQTIPAIIRGTGAY